MKHERLAQQWSPGGAARGGLKGIAGWRAGSRRDFAWENPVIEPPLMPRRLDETARG